MIRTTSGKVYLKQINYKYYTGFQGGMPYKNCGFSTTIYSVLGTGADKSLFSSYMSEMDVSVNNCVEGTGLVGISSNDLLSYFYNGPYANYYIKDHKSMVVNVHGNSVITKSVVFPFYTMYYNVRSLNNTIDCYAFRKDRGLSTDSTFLCFYTDTTKLLAKDNVKGYALPAIETSGGRFMTVVSPISIDSTINGVPPAV